MMTIVIKSDDEYNHRFFFLELYFVALVFDA